MLRVVLRQFQHHVKNGVPGGIESQAQHAAKGPGEVVLAAGDEQSSAGRVGGTRCGKDALSVVTVGVDRTEHVTGRQIDILGRRDGARSGDPADDAILVRGQFSRKRKLAAQFHRIVGVRELLQELGEK